jgi:hypothetical protein
MCALLLFPPLARDSAGRIGMPPPAVVYACTLGWVYVEACGCRIEPRSASGLCHSRSAARKYCWGSHLASPANNAQLGVRGCRGGEQESCRHPMQRLESILPVGITVGDWARRKERCWGLVYTGDCGDHRCVGAVGSGLLLDGQLCLCSAGGVWLYGVHLTLGSQRMDLGECPPLKGADLECNDLLPPVSAVAVSAAGV